jgi:hypothetical protein
MYRNTHACMILESKLLLTIYMDLYSQTMRFEPTEKQYTQFSTVVFSCQNLYIFYRPISRCCFLACS